MFFERAPCYNDIVQKYFHILGNKVEEAEFITCWEIAGAALSPEGIRVYLKLPVVVPIPRKSWVAGTIGISWQALLKLVPVKHWHPRAQPVYLVWAAGGNAWVRRNYLEFVDSQKLWLKHLFFSLRLLGYARGSSITSVYLLPIGRPRASERHLFLFGWSGLPAAKLVKSFDNFQFYGLHFAGNHSAPFFGQKPLSSSRQFFIPRPCCPLRCVPIFMLSRGNFNSWSSSLGMEW